MLLKYFMHPWILGWLLLALEWINSVVGTLDKVLAPGWTQTSEAGTSCISWTGPLCSHPGMLTFGFPAVSRPDLPQNLEWSGLCWQQASQRMRVLSWLQSNYRSLLMGPTGQNFLRSFGKRTLHESQSLTPPSCLSTNPSRMTCCWQKSTKIPVMTSYD